jgi:hypothetical protein
MADLKDKKFMDVAKKPEEATADIGSKPMIVGHKMATDPMVREEGTEAEQPVAEPSQDVAKLVPPSQKQKTFAPLPKTEEEAPVESKTEKVDEKVAKTDAAAKPAEPNDKSEKEEEKSQIDPVAAQMEKEDELQKLIASKKYFVSVKQARASNPLLTVLVLLLVVLAGLGTVFYLVDTDKLDVGFELPFSVFNKKEATTTETTTPTDQKEEVAPPKTSEEDSAAKADEKVSYANAAFGVNFDYPQSWGAVKVEQINGYADQTYAKEIPYFLDVTFSTLKDVEVRIINGRAFEGGRDFLGPFNQADSLIGFFHGYAHSYEKLSSGSYDLTRVSTENVKNDVTSDALKPSLYTFTEDGAQKTLSIEPKWTLANLDLLPWDAEANESLSQKDAEAQLVAKSKRLMIVRNYTSEKVIGINATYLWTTDQKDTVVETALLELVNSIK